LKVPTVIFTDNWVAVKILKDFMRTTKQKQAIEAVFNRSDRPLSVEEVTEAARIDAPSINTATVYRNLKVLVESGSITKISSVQAGTLYEINHSGHHHHFHCKKCGKTFDLPGCPLIHQPSLPEGFTTDSHELFYYGICADCSR